MVIISSNTSSANITVRIFFVYERFTQGFPFLCGGSERKEEDRITKIYFATVEHNTALQAVCVCKHTHRAYTVRKVVCSPQMYIYEEGN